MEDFEEDQPDHTDSNPPSALPLRVPRDEAALAMMTQRVRNVAAVARAQQKALRERRKPVRQPIE
jgi:hypothetical protein